MRVALVHDWLTGMRGGEKVLEALCERFPAADIFTLFHTRGSVSAQIEDHRIQTSWLERLPFTSKHYRRLLPLFPSAIERFDLRDYDFVVSSSHCVAKSVIPAAQARHLCYCHSPMRYAWDQFDAYFGADRVGAVTSRFVYRPIMTRLAAWDARTASRVHRFVANSRHVAGRIARYYNRRASVVYPPVDTAFYRPARAESESHFLIVSALVPYKRVELAIEACQQIGAPLRIVGDGPERARLEHHAGATVTFLGPMAGDSLRDEYCRAQAVIMPGEEDFGIVPVEAQACGRPVVAYGRGGALETVVDGETGVLFQDLTAASLGAALDRVAGLRFDADRLHAHAEQFSRDRHLHRMRETIEETLAAPVGTIW